MDQVPGMTENCFVDDLREENRLLWKSLRLAKAQRDRAILAVHVLGDEGWHPDHAGPYPLADLVEDGR